MHDFKGNEVSFLYHVSKYREMYGDGMNSSQNEIHSVIMKIFPSPEWYTAFEPS